MSNEKLREALQAISDIDDSTNHAVDASAALDRIGQIARQALALPTAAPVGEREAFEKWAREQFYSGLACPSDTWYDERKTYSDAAHHMAFCAFKAATQMTEQAAHEEIARLRAENAALSAGDAVDAQRTPLTVLQYNAIPELCAIPPSLYESVVRAIERAHGIDAAMRKGQI